MEQAKGNLSQSEADLEFARKQVALLQAEANLAAAQANLVKAQQDFDRLTPLVKEEAAAQQDLDTAVAALRRRRSQRACEPGECRPDATFDADADFVDRRKSGRAARRASHRRTESRVRDDPGADQRTDRRYAGAGGRAGDGNAPQPLTTIVPLDPIWVRFKVTESEYLVVQEESDAAAVAR